MALTESEKTELKNDILNAIKAESQGVNELTEVTSLDNIKSLPALRGTELVSRSAVPFGQTGHGCCGHSQRSRHECKQRHNQCRAGHEYGQQRGRHGEREGRHRTGGGRNRQWGGESRAGRSLHA